MSTTTAQHPIPDHVLLAYSAGLLPEAFSLVTACHLSLCEEARAAAESFDDVGGILLEGIEPVAVGDRSLSQTLARIGTEATPPEPRAVATGGLFPAPLRAIAGDPDDVPWRPVGGGVKQALLPCAGEGSVRLLHIEPGTSVPSHGHQGMEMTLVLQGAFSDKHGRFARGDLEYRDEPESHAPMAERGEACICLAATEAPLRFDGIVPRLLQPFIRV